MTLTPSTAKRLVWSVLALVVGLLLLPAIALAQTYPIKMADGYSVLRPMPAEDIGRAAYIVSQYRDAALDGVRQDGELGYWTAKITAAQRDGLALGLYVNGGAIAGVVAATRDDMDRTKAVLWCTETMWDVLGTRNSMREAAVAWARANGLQLGAFTRTWVPLQ